LVTVQVLDFITGGFLKSKKMKEPFIYRKDEKTAVARAGESKKAEGVMSMKFKAQLPGTGTLPLEQDVTVIGHERS